MAIISIAVTTASSRAWVLSVMTARLFVIMPATNSNTKTEVIATSDIRKAFLLMVPTLAVDNRSATVRKNMAKIVI